MKNKMIISVEIEHLHFIYKANEKEIIHFKIIYRWKWKRIEIVSEMVRPNQSSFNE